MEKSNEVPTRRNGHWLKGTFGCLLARNTPRPWKQLVRGASELDGCEALREADTCTTKSSTRYREAPTPESLQKRLVLGLGLRNVQMWEENGVGRHSRLCAFERGETCAK